jgi:rRNA maturation RNase YbeY
MIDFQSYDVPMPDLDYARIKRWIKQVAAGYGLRCGDINYIFCSDEHILAVNRRFLSHDYYTDVITFDYSLAQTIAGDIFISVDTVRSNAEQVGVESAEEMLRIIIHGVLHLTGQADKTPETRAIMTEKEELALRKWREMSV